MARFRKKPVEITAEQYRFEAHPPVEGVCTCAEGGGADHVHTAHEGQTVTLEDRDWIIPEPDGRGYYPIKPDIFANTYDPVG